MSKKLLNRRIIQFIVIFSLVGTAVVISKFSRNQNETTLSTNQIEEYSNEIEGVDLNNLGETKPVEMNQIIIEGLGAFEFNPKDIKAIRDDVFNEDFFSIFDVLIHLDKTGQINMDYEFSEEYGTHIIRDINGMKDWWYVANYDGGWSENNAWRMDLFPYKDQSSIQVRQIEIDRIQAIYASFAEEVGRTQSDNGNLIIPKVIIRGKNSAQVFENVDVTSHNLRDDFFHQRNDNRN